MGATQRDLVWPMYTSDRTCSGEMQRSQTEWDSLWPINSNQNTKCKQINNGVWVVGWLVGCWAFIGCTNAHTAGGIDWQWWPFSSNRYVGIY